LRVDKHRSSYEDTIVQLERVASMALLNEVIHNAEQISSNPADPKVIPVINNINSLREFRESLNTSMVILDKMR